MRFEIAQLIVRCLFSSIILFIVLKLLNSLVREEVEVQISKPGKSYERIVKIVAVSLLTITTLLFFGALYFCGFYGEVTLW